MGAKQAAGAASATLKDAFEISVYANGGRDN